MRASLISAAVLLLASCDHYEPGYHTVIQDRDEAAEWITETVRAANPMSDEEPEDNIKRAAVEARQLFGVRVVGVWRAQGANRLEFIPYDECTPAHKALVDAWRTGEAQ